jgi:hypothetical protein
MKVLPFLPVGAMLVSATACERATQAAIAPKPPEVLVANVQQKDVPRYQVEPGPFQAEHPFAETSGALIAHQRFRESRAERGTLEKALEDRLRLAYMRYRGGVDNQLNTLDADRDLFQTGRWVAVVKWVGITNRESQ